ncbi:16S rRNA pseudouridine516 synthase [Geomicrobium halophilum]|uniref:Pseudouridine synthase n=1 Tax=Geomicrobium halophilum TaxID=549000 RepID=A0A841PPA2_9BACL|nr:pseudouridine synthase [Geomicrobium halophilum]MBB6448101.1 16S rRNA pseudouridine516 synthase [Geomicrobium halophilum]
MSEQWRIDKWLAAAGVGSRKDVKKILKKKAVQVNGTTITDAAVKINVDEDKITVNGSDIHYHPGPVYYMMNKRKGRISATSDDQHTTVLDDIDSGDKNEGLFPVGRLDKDTSGLLLLTTDGTWAHQLTTPNLGIEKQYEAWLDEKPSTEDLHKVGEGLQLKDGTQTKPAEIGEGKQEEEGYSLMITVTEGKYHQVKRMFGAIGRHVRGLKRVRMSDVALDPALAEGEYRALTAEELEAIDLDLNSKKNTLSTNK